MKKKTWQELIDRINELKIEKPNLVVGIERGGVMPAALIATKLEIPLETIRINFRNDDHVPNRKVPELLIPIDFDCTNKNILIVDDVSKTGETLELAKKVLNSATQIKTIVVNGKADYSLFDEECFIFPWA